MKGVKILILLTLLFAEVEAQNFEKPNDSLQKSAFVKKFMWGLSVTQSWSTIKGSSLPSTYFSKASIGVHSTAEYFPLNFLGVSIGAGYQQRGTGIINTNTGPVDSTYRERLRFNTYEFPIAVILRTPKDIIKGLRFSGSLGIVPVINGSARNVKISLEPNVANLDQTKDVSASYFKTDLAYQFTAGPEIDMAGSQVIKIQFYYSQGTKNVYTAGQGTGHNQNIGIRLSWMF